MGIVVVNWYIQAMPVPAAAVAFVAVIFPWVGAGFVAWASWILAALCFRLAQMLVLQQMHFRLDVSAESITALALCVAVVAACLAWSDNPRHRLSGAIALGIQAFATAAATASGGIFLHPWSGLLTGLAVAAVSFSLRSLLDLPDMQRAYSQMIAVVAAIAGVGTEVLRIVLYAAQ